MIKSLHISIIILVFFVVKAYAYDEPPKQFTTKADAVKNGCQLQTLKYQEKENCIINEFDDHNLIIFIYDSNPNGTFERTNQLTITSWYHFAEISYEDLLGNGIKFIKIESEGNTGTGTLQKILSYWGWHDNKFVLVFFETTSYYISGRYLEELKMNYEFNNKGSKQLSAVLKFSYSNNNPKHKAKYKWSETFNWQAIEFSFYNFKQEENKLQTARNPIYKKIINARINQIKRVHSMSIIDTAFLNEVEIMQILSDKSN